MGRGGALNYKTMVWWKKSRPGPGGKACGIPYTAYRTLSDSKGVVRRHQLQLVSEKVALEN